MFIALVAACACRELRTLYVGEGQDGDCFSSSCSFDVAANLVQNGDTLIFDDGKMAITSFPSTLSDLLHTAMYMNVTFKSKSGKSVFDGRFMAGESLFNVHSAARYSWVKFVGFTFTNFEKPVMIRIMAETQWPLVIFNDDTFIDNKEDCFNLKGGTFQFSNCVFKNNLRRPIKAITEAIVQMTDCRIERCESCFFFDCDVSFQNCLFTENYGGRGGALYLSKVTLYVDGCKFIHNRAKTNGGAIYIREAVEEYQCEVRRSVFLENRAGVNGTAYYSYWADGLIRDSCFSDDESRSIFEYRSNNSKDGNVYTSKCEDLLKYSPPMDDYDPYVPNPEDDIDVDVPPNSIVDL